MMVEFKKNSLLIVFEVIGITILALVASVFIGVLFLIPLLSLGYRVQTTLVLAGIVILGQVGFLIVAYFHIRLRDIKVPMEMPTRSDLKYLGGGAIISLIAGVGLSQVLSLLNLMPESVIDELAAMNPTFLLALAVLSGLLIAPAEELLFRGAIQGRLRQRFGAVTAVGGASFLFGSLHLGNYTGEILPIIAAALLTVLLGVILGVVYERTKNLAVPILVHAIYNVALLIPSYFAIV